MTERTDRRLDELLIALPEDARARFQGLLTSVLPLAPDADSAIVGLTHIAKATGNPRWLVDYFLEDPATLEALLVVLGGSGFAARTLALHPEYLELLADRKRLAQPKGLTEIQKELEATLRPFRNPTAKLDALRRFRRRETVRLIAADLLGLLDLASVTAELSDLAEGIIKATFAFLPPERGCRMSVIAFGKLGARELNYSSDIDLVFFHDGDAMAAERWTRKFVQALSEVTAYGRLYRVDLRLRPYGATAPLSMALDAALSYYESWSEPSERLALLKARAIAGDEELAQRFERFRVSLVFGNPLEPEELAWLLRVKARTEAVFATDASVKHGIGGIRDGEMTVQFLQLAFAYRFPDLSVRDTLTALERLQQHKLLTVNEATTLRDGYRFLRRLEHMLQIAEDLPMQTLPTDERGLMRLAKCMGFKDGNTLLNAFQSQTQAVRQVYETVTDDLARVLGISEQTMVSLSIASGLDADEMALRTYGFTQLGEAQRRLHRLVHGDMVGGLPWRDRVRIMRVLPIVLDAVARTPDPDTALTRLENLLSALGARSAVLDSLSSNPIALRALALVASLSEPLCQLAMHHPEQLEALLSGAPIEHAFGFTPPDKMLSSLWLSPSELEKLFALPLSEHFAALPKKLFAGIKGRIALRLGFAHLCRLMDSETVGQALAHLADVILDAAITSLTLPASCRLAVFALGGWGGGELHFGSDLDVAFAHSGKQEDAEQMVRQLRALLSEPTEEGIAYRLDLRLRPTGQEGALSSDVDAWREFAKQKFEAWMALAWTRLRFASGDRSIGETVISSVHQRLYELGLTDEMWEELQHLLERIRTEHRPPKEVMDLKHSDGALWDIELEVAKVQLQDGHNDLPLRTPSVLIALRSLTGRSEEWQKRLQAYLWLRQLRLWLSWIVPNQPTRFMRGDAVERLLAWLDSNPQPLTQQTLVSVDDAVGAFRHKWRQMAPSIAQS